MMLTRPWYLFRQGPMAECLRQQATHAMISYVMASPVMLHIDGTGDDLE